MLLKAVMVNGNKEILNRRFKQDILFVARRPIRFTWNVLLPKWEEVATESGTVQVLTLQM
jgi:hypothetical protein